MPFLNTLWEQLIRHKIWLSKANLWRVTLGQVDFFGTINLRLICCGCVELNRSVLIYLFLKFYYYFFTQRKVSFYWIHICSWSWRKIIGLQAFFGKFYLSNSHENVTLHWTTSNLQCALQKISFFVLYDNKRIAVVFIKTLCFWLFVILFHVLIYISITLPNYRNFFLFCSRNLFTPHWCWQFIYDTW